MRHHLNDFLMRGIMASHAVRDLRASGILRTPSASTQERRDHDLFAPVAESIRGGSIAMQRCYRLLFVLENLLREFVAGKFIETDGDDWFEKRATSDMKRNVDKRRQSEAKNQWHVGRNSGDIYYLDFGDLGLLMINHWAEFKDLLPDQSWVTSRVQEAERSRNVIAHTNVLASDEIERLEMYVRDWIRQIG